MERCSLIHLLGCACCRERLLGALEAWEAPPEQARVLPFGRRRRFASESAAGASDDWLGFGKALDRWFLHTASACREEEDRVDALLAELMARRETERRALVRDDPRFHSWVLAARLLEESRALSFDRPRHGERLTRLAVDVLHRLDPEVYGERLIRDLEGRAWAVLGNSLRLAGDLDGSDRAFDLGARCLAESFDPLERADFLGMLGALRRDQRRFDEALEALDQAHDLYEQIREKRRIPRVLTKKGFLWLERAEPEKALELLLEARRCLVPGEDFRTELAVHHNLCWCYVELERYTKARKLFKENKALYARADDSWTRVRARWLEGNLEAGTGDEARAEELLAQVRDSFTASGQEYESALVSLDLAVLYARQRRFGELRHLAAEMASVFTAHHIHREAILALAFFQQAAERETLTAETVRRLAVYVKKSRFEPGSELELG